MQVLCETVQQAKGGSVKLAWADRGYTSEEAKQTAQGQGIDLQVVKLPEAKKGFVLLPRCWVVDRSFGWVARFLRLSRDYERLPEDIGRVAFRDVSDAYATRGCADVSLERFVNLFSNYWFIRKLT